MTHQTSRWVLNLFKGRTRLYHIGDEFWMQWLSRVGDLHMQPLPLHMVYIRWRGVPLKHSNLRLHTRQELPEVPAEDKALSEPTLQPIHSSLHHPKVSTSRQQHILESPPAPVTWHCLVLRHHVLYHHIYHHTFHEYFLILVSPVSRIRENWRIYFCFFLFKPTHWTKS